jgi:hypothetical protein
MTKKNLIVFTFLLSSLIITSCSNRKEVTGRIYSYQKDGSKCWYIRDEKTGRQYDVLSNTSFFLRENNRMKLVLKPTKTETPCNANKVMELVSYSNPTTTKPSTTYSNTKRKIKEKLKKIRN